MGKVWWFQGQTSWQMSQPATQPASAGVIAAGNAALYLNTIGNCNVATGFQALRNTTGSNNVGIGCNSGADAMCNITTQSNNVILGNNDTTVVYSKVAPTNASDVRWKKIDESGVGLALPFVQALTPIKFQFCNAETGEVTDDRYRYGFSAQEILANEELPENPIIVRTENPDMYSVNEGMMIPVLVNAIKELTARIEALEAK
jgi:hypothetical protein